VTKFGINNSSDENVQINGMKREMKKETKKGNSEERRKRLKIER